MRLIQNLSSEFSKLDENKQNFFLASAIAVYSSFLMFICCNLIVMFGGK